MKRKFKVSGIVRHIAKNPDRYLIIVAIISCYFFILEFFDRFGFSLDAPIESWLMTATYFNNLFSPIFLFILVLLLYRTWKYSKEALKAQKDELEATKSVLKEQTDTQNFSVFKEALFEITDSIDTLLKRKYCLSGQQMIPNYILKGAGVLKQN